MIDTSENGLMATILELVPNMIGFVLALAYAYKVSMRVADTNKILVEIIAKIATEKCLDEGE